MPQSQTAANLWHLEEEKMDSAFRKLLSSYVFSYFPFSFEGRMWDLIVSVPDHCLPFYFMCFYANSTLNVIFWLSSFREFEKEAF